MLVFLCNMGQAVNMAQRKSKWEKECQDEGKKVKFSGKKFPREIKKI